MENELLSINWGNAIVVVVVGIGLVVCILIILVFILKFFKHILEVSGKKKVEPLAIAATLPVSGNISEEIAAAISATIYLYNNEFHDEERAILTIKHNEKPYSPWSSKIHNLNFYKSQK